MRNILSKWFGKTPDLDELILLVLYRGSIYSQGDRVYEGLPIQKIKTLLAIDIRVQCVNSSILYSLNKLYDSGYITRINVFVPTVAVHYSLTPKGDNQLSKMLDKITLIRGL